jgi:2-dehydro-3-deoxygluconokinase
VMRQGLVVSVGECMVELSQPQIGARVWQVHSGGDTYNCAVYLARLGARVSYLTALGSDPFSDSMRGEWQREGVSLDLVLRHPERNVGLYAITNDAAGERSFTYWRSQSAARALFECTGIEQALDRAGGAALLYLSGITLSLFGDDGRDRLANLARAARERGGVVAFDPNYRAKGWANAPEARKAIEAFAPHVTVALPTFDDERLLYGDTGPDATIARWKRAGCTEIAVKLGANGALVADAATQTAVAPPAVLQPRDTTGAGDSFNAAYLAARLAGLPIESAAAAGNRLAGAVIRQAGAIIPRATMPIDLPRCDRVAA